MHVHVHRTPIAHALHVQDVKHEIGMQRQQSASGKGGSFGGGSASKHREVGLGDFGPQERERVMELLLSQERDR